MYLAVAISTVSNTYTIVLETAKLCQYVPFIITGSQNMKNKLYVTK